MFFHVAKDVEEGDVGAAESAAIAWILALKASDASALGFSGLRERELYRDV